MYIIKNVTVFFQNSRQALQPLEPVDHLTGHMMVKCLDRIQALTDERDLIKTKLQVRNKALDKHNCKHQ